MKCFQFNVFELKVAPKILPFNFGEEDYTSGMSAQLQCIVTEGDLPVDIRWTTLGTTHSALLGITVTKIGSKSSILQIDSVDASHTGNYTCTARNAAGQASYSAQLTVVGSESIPHPHLLPLPSDPPFFFCSWPIKRSGRYLFFLDCSDLIPFSRTSYCAVLVR